MVYFQEELDEQNFFFEFCSGIVFEDDLINHVDNEGEKMTEFELCSLVHVWIS